MPTALGTVAAGKGAVEGSTRHSVLSSLMSTSHLLPPTSLC